MDANEYQNQALRTWKDDEEDHFADRMYAAGKLCAEAGEVMQPIAKYVKHGKAYGNDEIYDELGDVLWYVAILCDLHGLRLGDVMAGNIDKLRKRHPDGDTSQFYGRDS
jgi:NTP pyrophosphatase (non-canonical NTP hydrolase)